ncbi:MAG: hypothetical protein K0S61_1836 [Anaerocolumna sp.]|nr:hypothetical protein [Anaerocolumna sp.]
MTGHMVYKSIERYGVLELKFKGFQEGNPFVDYYIKGTFSGKSEKITSNGFYDGNGIYIIRFMPSFEGEYNYHIEGSFSEQIYEGNFFVSPAKENNHGPVRVADKFHFTYEDGTPYYPMGTTCYAWTHQPIKMQEETLNTLKNSPFNKIRFCIFPKHYDYNLYEPITFPYEGIPCDISDLSKENFMDYIPTNPDNHWEFKKFNPEHYQILERRILDLMELGIQADLILMHPYDRWGFSYMDRESNALYVKYIVARFAAFRNVWWSLANEYDLCEAKTTSDWEEYGEILCKDDPYNRLRSIHNCKTIYDYKRPWITHCSIQRTEIYLSAANTKMWREQYGKPVVIDEAGYEGNINYSWGNLTGEEMVRLFWMAAVRGGYLGHGETYMHPEDKLWWSHGGTLYGESADRIGFLYKIISEVPGLGLEPVDIKKWEENSATAAHAGYRGKYFLFYTGHTRPSFKEFYFNNTKKYRVEVIDTWNMTISDKGVYSGKFKIDLPSKEYMALRIVEV